MTAPECFIARVGDYQIEAVSGNRVTILNLREGMYCSIGLEVLAKGDRIHVRWAITLGRYCFIYKSTYQGTRCMMVPDRCYFMHVYPSVLPISKVQHSERYHRLARKSR